MDIICPQCQQEFDVYKRKAIEEIIEWDNNCENLVERTVTVCPHCHVCLELSRTIEILDFGKLEVEAL